MIDDENYNIEQNDNTKYENVNSDYAKEYTPDSDIYSKGNKKTNKVKHKVQITAGLIILLMLFSLIFGGFGGYIAGEIIANRNAASGEREALSYQTVIRNVSNKSEADEPMTFEDVSEVVANSVVEIKTEFVTYSSVWMTQYVNEGAGSGVIISTDGYIVTNNHVIDEASKITVKLYNGEVYDATLIASDEQTDLAVLKIEADGLSPAVLGVSSELKVGNRIVVVGNPLGELGGSVSQGIISALDRNITIDEQQMVLLQTDAAVNPGNSGGGMFNMYGELVGIVNAKGSGSDIDNIGFAIPVDIVKDVVDQLLSVGYVQGRAYLGITMVDILNERLASNYRVNDLGVYIYSIEEDTNAYRAGLRAGDMIVSINDIAIGSASEVTALLKTLTTGEEIKVTVKRSETEKSFTFILQESVPN